MVSLEQNPPSISRPEAMGALEMEVQVAQYGSGENGLALVAHETAFGKPLITAALIARIAQIEARKIGVGVSEPLTLAPAEKIEIILEEIFQIFPEHARNITHFRNGIREREWTMWQLMKQVIPLQNGSGVRERFWTPTILSREEVITRSTEIGALLLKKIITAKNWTDVDAVIVTSAFLPTQMAEQIVKRLIEEGVIPSDAQRSAPRHLSEIRMFCSGVNIAFAHALSHPAIRQTGRVAILALEPIQELLFAVHGDWAFSLQTAKLSSMFGNDFVGIGFNPGALELDPSTCFLFDRKDHMAVQSWYVDPTQVGIPPHLRDCLIGGEQNLLYEEVDRRSTLTLPGDHITDAARMDPSAVKHDFTSAAPAIFAELIRELGLSASQVALFNHEPSAAVITRVAKLLEDLVPGFELTFNRSGQTIRRVRSFPGPHRGSNASSATILRQILEFAQAYPGEAPTWLGGTNPDLQAVALLGMGIGSTVGATVFRGAKSE